MSVVLDASAVLALVRGEPGGDEIASIISKATMSAVNLQEVAKTLLRDGVPIDEMRSVLGDLALDVRAHDEEAALSAAALYAATKRYGSGVGDRSCMALGIALGVPVVTADREWAKIEVPGLNVRLLR